MTKKQFLRNWYTGMTIAGAIVGVVAALLLAIIATARSILSNAQRALNLANEIVKTTRPIWQLEQTNAAALQLAREAQAIEQHAGEVADSLEEPRAGG